MRPGGFLQQRLHFLVLALTSSTDDRLRLQSLLNKRVLSLDLSALLAGAGVRGQFEERFKALLKDIDEEGGGVICFIDEIHTLLNLGASASLVD